jgi:hypothetical protein
MTLAIRGQEELGGGKIAARLNASDKVKIRERALMAGLTLSEFIRRACLGRKVVMKPNRAALEYVRRGVEDLRALLAGANEEQRAQADAALGWLRQAMNLLGRD